MDKLDWKTKTLIAGTILGTITGLIVSYVLVKRAEQNEETVQITASEGVQLGMGLLGLVRLISK